MINKAKQEFMKGRKQHYQEWANFCAKRLKLPPNPNIAWARSITLSGSVKMGGSSIKGGHLLLGKVCIAVASDLLEKEYQCAVFFKPLKKTLPTGMVILHELIHDKYPDYTEVEVKNKTNKLYTKFLNDSLGKIS